MGKPLGISVLMNPDSGLPRFSITPISRVSDMIWDAVQEALCANMTPEQFRRESAQAWQHYLREEAKDADKEFSKST